MIVSLSHARETTCTITNVFIEKATFVRERKKYLIVSADGHRGHRIYIVNSFIISLDMLHLLLFTIRTTLLLLRYIYVDHSISMKHIEGVLSLEYMFWLHISRGSKV
jgi:hypothetical protein